MPLHLYANIFESGSVSPDWQPRPGKVLKYPVRNPAVMRELRKLKKGHWQKVIKEGDSGEVHYFEHASGCVAGVKFFAWEF